MTRKTKSSTVVHRNWKALLGLKPSEFLPNLFALITKKSRYLPEVLDFNWKGNVVHSLLMCYYAVFWRKMGIRVGGLSYYQDSTGKRGVGIQNVMGALMYLEHEVIRQMEWKWRYEWVKVPVLQPAYAGVLGLEPKFKWVLFAIAYDAGQGRATGTSTSPALASVAPTGSDRLLCTHLNFGATTVSTVPTFGGSASTIIATNQNTSDGVPNLSTYRLVAPSTSSGSITATLAASIYWVLLAQTYTGIDQTTPTAVETGSEGALGTALSISATSDANGSWHFISAKQDSAGTGFTAGANTTARQQGAAAITNGMFDSNATVANTVSHTNVINWTGGGQKIAYQDCMLRPVPSTAYTKTLTDAVVLVDTVLKTDSKTFAEVVTLVDTMIRNTTMRALSEVITLVDTITPTKIQVREFVESITLVDSVVRTISKVYSEAITLVANVYNSSARTLIETITLVDTMVKNLTYSKILTGTITLADTLIRRISNYVAKLPFHKGYRKNESPREGKRLDG